MVAPVRADEPFVFGSGSASASVARARLFYGGLSLPLGVGTSSASYTNQQSRALGIALDIGAYAGLAGDVPPELNPATVDSNSGDKTAKGNLDAGEAVARVNLSAKGVPEASSDVDLADVNLPALVRVEGAHTNSSVGVKDKKQRHAESFAEVARVEIAGIIALEGLRWEATQRTGFEPKAAAAFDIGRVVIGGVPVPLPAGDISAALQAINKALTPVGLRVETPTVTRNAEGGISITPLRVALAYSPLGKKLLAPIIGSARPLISPVMQTLVDANSTLGLVGLVADIVLGVGDGSGGVEVMIGGANASTNSVGFVAPSGGGSPVGPIGVGDASLDGTPPLSALPGSLNPGSEEFLDTPATAASQGPLRCVLKAGPQRKGECRSSNTAVALVISVVAVVGLGAAEYVSRRRRRRGTDEVIA